jgi:hypothetical protein
MPDSSRTDMLSTRHEGPWRLALEIGIYWITDRGHNKAYNGDKVWDAKWLQLALGYDAE